MMTLYEQTLSVKTNEQLLYCSGTTETRSTRECGTDSWLSTYSQVVSSSLVFCRSRRNKPLNLHSSFSLDCRTFLGEAVWPCGRAVHEGMSARATRTRTPRKLLKNKKEKPARQSTIADWNHLTGIPLGQEPWGNSVSMHTSGACAPQTLAALVPGGGHIWPSLRTADFLYLFFGPFCLAQYPFVCAASSDFVCLKVLLQGLKWVWF